MERENRTGRLTATRYHEVEGLNGYHRLLNGKGGKVIESAIGAAIEFGSHELGTGHLLLGIARTKGTYAYQILQERGVTPEIIIEQLECINIRGKNSGTPSRLTQRVTMILDTAASTSKTLGLAEIRVEDLLAEVAREGAGIGVEVLRRLRVNPDFLRSNLREKKKTEN